MHEHHARLGLYLAPAGEMNGGGSHGVVVMGVDPNGAAATKGVQQGDVILEAGGKSVSAPAEVSQAAESAGDSGKKALLLRLRTQQGTRYVALPLSAEQNNQG
jgi:serine protease Do